MLRSLTLLLTLLIACFWAEPSFATQRVGGISPISDPNYTPVSATACNQLKSSSGGSFLKEIVALQGNNFNLVSTGSVICPCAPEPGLWIERIVFCFASSPHGLVYNITQNLVVSLMPMFKQIYAAIAMLAIIIFGWKLTMGALRDVKAETITFLLKLGGVLTFLAWFPFIHHMVLTLTQALADIAGDAINQFASICQMKTSVKPNLWAQWDCVFGNLIGASVVDPTSKFFGSPVFMGLVGMLGAFFLKIGWGTIIVFAAIYVLITLIFAVMRMVTTYLLATIAVSFLTILGLIFIPTILFKNTMPSYSVWLQITISYMIQPFLLVLFMGIMLVALDFAVFKGPNSLVGIISNTNPVPSTTSNGGNSGATAPGEAMFRNPPANKDMTSHFSPQNIETSRVNVNPEITPADPSKPDGFKYGEDQGKMGVFGNQPVVDRSKLTGKDSVAVTVRATKLDEDKLVEDLKNRPNAHDTNLTKQGYMKRLFLSMLSTCMLVYTLFTMLGHLPKITHDLTASPVSGNIATVKALGEEQLKKAIALVREGVKLAIDIKTGGALSKAQSASGGNTSFKDLATKMYKNSIGKS